MFFIENTPLWPDALYVRCRLKLKNHEGDTFRIYQMIIAKT